MPEGRIVIVDDEKDMRDFLEIMLKRDGYSVSTFASASDALVHCSSNPFDMVISDIRMPGMGGVDFLKAVKELDPDAPVIMITAYASVDTAVEAMKAGAYDYFIKPFKVDEIKLNIKNCLSMRALKRENELLRKDIKSRTGFKDLIGTSRKMAEVYGLIMSVARTRTTVLITGESGTGKELAARAIHAESDRHDKPFVAVNCGAIPYTLLESELFGHVKGAFTGAVTGKEGLAETADGGTLFLDEITELPLQLQVKLLRFIQERTFRRVGGTSDITVDIRLIAATNRDMEAEAKAGRFREDLFYRLNVIRINMPPLRERREDILPLAMHFMERHSKSLGKEVAGVSEEALKLLLDHDYPGNVRELENIIERAVTLAPSNSIIAGSLPPELRGVPARPPQAPAAGAAAPLPLLPVAADGPVDLERRVEEYERAMIEDALKKADGVKKRAAEFLGLSFRSFRYKLSKYGIDKGSSD